MSDERRHRTLEPWRGLKRTDVRDQHHNIVHSVPHNTERKLGPIYNQRPKLSLSEVEPSAGKVRTRGGSVLLTCTFSKDWDARRRLGYKLRNSLATLL